MTLIDLIKEVQKRLGVTVDGIAGKDTFTAMLNELKPVSTEGNIPNSMATQILYMEDHAITGPDSLRVTKLPSGDGGGTYEIAGICDGIEPDVYKSIKLKLDSDKREEAWQECLDYVLLNTKAAAAWSNNAGIQFFLRDIIFNMGKGGCVNVMQRAVGNVTVDGVWGPNTQKAWNRFTTELVVERQLVKLVNARLERYNAIIEANPVKAKFRTGWTNRTREAQTFAENLLEATI